MAEKLPQTDSAHLIPLPERVERIKLGVVGFFFLGLFLLAIGAGLFWFKGSSSGEDIAIISANSDSSAEIIVHVEGAVLQPGVYQLPAGSRVNDAIIKAGGLREDADRAKINLAAKIADGQKVYIPEIGQSPSVGQVAGISANLININTAPASELDKLPGVGPVTAQKIITSRPYTSLEDLLTKKVVPRSVFEKIQELITY